MAKPLPQAFRLDLGRYELRRSDGVKVKIERQPMELLILLAERKCLLVTREEVAARLWPAGISVDTGPAINNAIRKIRTALRDSPECPTHLETVVGKGYRFIGDLEVIGAEAPPAKAPPGLVPPAAAPPAQAAPPARNGRFPLAVAGMAVLLAAGIGGWALWRSAGSSGPGAIRSLAVLPLQNLSGDPAQDYVADGITDELTTNLAKIGSLRVISRTSTMQYGEHRGPMPQIVKELNVDSVIEGSVVRSGSKVRITAQLIDARHDAHLWAQSYERDFGDLLDLEDAIALDIASQVRTNLSPQERGKFAAHHRIDADASEAYLHGRAELAKQTQPGMRNGVRYFQRAVEIDPLYAAGYAGLADSFSLMANYGVLPPKEVFPRAEAAARKALELDPLSAEAHAALGVARHHFEWDWTGAEAEYRRAVQLTPSSSMAHLRYAELLSNAGRNQEAIGEITRARELDPLSVTIANNVSRVLYYARRYDDVVRESKQLLAINPDRIYAHVYLGGAYEQKHMYSQAIAEFNRVAELTGGPGVSLAHAYALAGRSDAARQLLRDHVEVLDESGVLDWFFIAGVYAALGDKDGAFAWLEKATEKRDFFLTYLKADPGLDPLRSDPRLKLLYKKVGLPE